MDIGKPHLVETDGGHELWLNKGPGEWSRVGLLTLSTSSNKIVIHLSTPDQWVSFTVRPAAE